MMAYCNDAMKLLTIKHVRGFGIPIPVGAMTSPYGSRNRMRAWEREREREKEL
jgi:hypothetical protein